MGVYSPRPSIRVATSPITRAAMDGYAVRATDTFGASERSPAVLQRAETVGPTASTRVHTGGELPKGADTVVMVEHAEEHGESLEVFDPVAEGENVAPVGEDVRMNQRLYEPVHRLDPTDCRFRPATRYESACDTNSAEYLVLQ